MVVCAFCGVSFLTHDGLINDLACPQWNGEVTGHKKTAAGERCPRAIQRAAPAATAPKSKSTASKAKEKSAAAAPKSKPKSGTVTAKKTIAKRSPAASGSASSAAGAKKLTSKLTNKQLETHLRGAGLETGGTKGLMTSRLLTGVRDGKVKVGDVKALAKEMGVPTKGNGDELRTRVATALGALGAS